MTQQAAWSICKLRFQPFPSARGVMHNPEAHESTLAGHAAQQQAGAKKSYHSPELKVHGTVQEQTLANAGGDSFDNNGYS